MSDENLKFKIKNLKLSFPCHAERREASVKHQLHFKF